MDSFNKAIQQISDLFQQMTLTARITSGLLLLAIVVALGFLFQAQTSGVDEYLFGGESYSQRELANMETAFSKSGLAHWQIVGSKMKVPRGKRDSYLKALRDNDAMPDSLNHYTAKQVDKDNPFNGSKSREIAMKVAKERELGRMIRGIKGIEEANVMYDESSSGTFSRRLERRVSVSVKAQGNRPLSEEEVRTVRNMVIGAITQLSSADVTVIDMNSGRSFPGGEGNTDNVYAVTKRKYEDDYRDKIASQLTMIPGVVVGVNVELNPEVAHTTSGVKIDGKSVNLHSSNTETVKPVVIQTAPAGRPGANPNGLGNSAQAVTNQSIAAEPETTTKSETRAVTPYQQFQTQKASLVPTSVTASIDVPTSYFVKVWKERNPSDKGSKDEKKPDPAELKKIEDEVKLNVESKVAMILPPSNGGPKSVTVTSFTELAGPEIAGPSSTDAATSWLASNWQTLATIGVALASLLILRGALKSIPPEPSLAASAAGSPDLKVVHADDDEDGEESEDKEAAKRKFRTSGPNLRAELTELVKEDPDTAANILKSWIGDAA